MPQLARDIRNCGSVLQQQRRAGVAHLVEPAKRARKTNVTPHRVSDDLLS
jgi:hypothetical protein